MSTALLLTCHGTVENLDDIPAFLANIRRGRPPAPDIIQEVRRRFERIGGSPLMRITRGQADALSARLKLPVFVAGRLWKPYPKEVIAELHAKGVRTLISLPLAPQSVHIYHASVREAAAAYPDIELREVPPWGLEPALTEAFVESIGQSLGEFSPSERASLRVILSAHSLPMRIIEAGDPYEQQFRSLAAQVSKELQNKGIESSIAFQSQGMTQDAWLGPDLPSTFKELVSQGIQNALIAPIGFVADHVETLYDLDIEAQELAKQAGLKRLLRAPAMNTRPRFMDALENVARRALA